MFMGSIASYVLKVAVFLLMLPLEKGVSTSDSAPTIKLEGRQLTADMFYVYQLECSTPNTFHGCSVEILLNNVTKETIRYFNYTCYNGKGICSPFQCACSNECNKFSWNYTVKEELKDQIFKCDSRIQDNNFFYKVFASGFFKDGDFVDGHNAFELVSKNQSSSHKVLTDKESTVTTLPKEQQNYSMYSDIKGLITAVLCIVCLHWMTCIICILLFYCICLRSCKDDKDETDMVHRRRSRAQYNVVADMLDRRMSRARYDDKLDRRISRAQDDDKLDHRISLAQYDDKFDRRMSNAQYDDKLDRRISRAQDDDKLDRRISRAQDDDMLDRRMSRARYDDKLDRRMSNAQYDDMLDRRMSRGQYGEISQDEDSNDEENEGQHLTRRKFFENEESAETCRSTIDKSGQHTIRKTRRSYMNAYKFKHKLKYLEFARKYASQNVDIGSYSDVSSNEEESNISSCFPSIYTMEKDLNSAAEHDNWQQSDETDESHTLKKNKPVLKEKASRDGLTRKYHQNKQKQTCTLQSPI